jgi:hypothetical protein
VRRDVLAEESHAENSEERSDTDESPGVRHTWMRRLRTPDQRGGNAHRGKPTKSQGSRRAIEAKYP